MQLVCLSVAVSSIRPQAGSPNIMHYNQARHLVSLAIQEETLSPHSVKWSKPSMAIGEIDIIRCGVMPVQSVMQPMPQHDQKSN